MVDTKEVIKKLIDNLNGEDRVEELKSFYKVLKKSNEQENFLEAILESSVLSEDEKKELLNKIGYNQILLDGVFNSLLYIPLNDIKSSNIDEFNFKKNDLLCLEKKHSKEDIIDFYKKLFCRIITADLVRSKLVDILLERMSLLLSDEDFIELDLFFKNKNRSSEHLRTLLWSIMADRGLDQEIIKHHFDNDGNNLLISLYNAKYLGFSKYYPSIIEHVSKEKRMEFLDYLQEIHCEDISEIMGYFDDEEQRIIIDKFVCKWSNVYSILFDRAAEFLSDENRGYLITRMLPRLSNSIIINSASIMDGAPLELLVQELTHRNASAMELSTFVTNCNYGYERIIKHLMGNIKDLIVFMENHDNIPASGELTDVIINSKDPKNILLYAKNCPNAPMGLLSNEIVKYEDIFALLKFSKLPNANLTLIYNKILSMDLNMNDVYYITKNYEHFPIERLAGNIIEIALRSDLKNNEVYIDILDNFIKKYYLNFSEEILSSIVKCDNPEFIVERAHTISRSTKAQDAIFKRLIELRGVNSIIKFLQLPYINGREEFLKKAIKGFSSEDIVLLIERCNLRSQDSFIKSLFKKIGVLSTIFEKFMFELKDFDSIKVLFLYLKQEEAYTLFVKYIPILSDEEIIRIFNTLLEEDLNMHFSVTRMALIRVLEENGRFDLKEVLQDSSLTYDSDCDVYSEYLIDELLEYGLAESTTKLGLDKKKIFLSMSKKYCINRFLPAIKVYLDFLTEDQEFDLDALDNEYNLLVKNSNKSPIKKEI